MNKRSARSRTVAVILNTAKDSRKRTTVILNAAKDSRKHTTVILNAVKDLPQTPCTTSLKKILRSLGMTVLT